MCAPLPMGASCRCRLIGRSSLAPLRARSMRPRCRSKSRRVEMETDRSRFGWAAFRFPWALRQSTRPSSLLRVTHTTRQHGTGDSAITTAFLVGGEKLGSAARRQWQLSLGAQQAVLPPGAKERASASCRGVVRHESRSPPPPPARRDR